MIEIKDIDVSNFKLVQPDYIKKVNKELECYDIEVENRNNFFIRTDKDLVLSHNCDGSHIASLIINLFYLWFPNVIRQGRLFILKTPLLSVKDKNKMNYFYDMDEFTKFALPKNAQIRYHKGLGSLSKEDWIVIFEDMKLLKILEDSNSAHMMKVAFGLSAGLRKKWLQS